MAEDGWQTISLKFNLATVSQAVPLISKRSATLLIADNPQRQSVSHEVAKNSVPE